MEFEQIIKRLDWLDEEHRKEKSALEDLTARLTSLEGEIKVLHKKAREQSSQLSNISSIAARFSEFDAVLARQRGELAKFWEDLDVRRKEAQEEVDKRYQLQFDNIQKSLVDLKKAKDAVAEFKRETKTRAEEDARRNKLMAEWESRMQTILKGSETIERNLKLSDETRRQESKRLVDLQADVSSLRKRLDATREKADLNENTMKRLDTRLNEVLAADSDHRQGQVSFTETQALMQIEREHARKQWDDQLATLRKQIESMDHHIQDWDTGQRALKRAQETYDDLVQKFERRINEITEMQRLAEDRFRQEWITFKSDDQKRWTSFALSQDENHKDTRSEVGKLSDRLTAIEDLAQTQQDMLQQTKEANEQLFQGMLAQIHELLSAYERIMGTR